MARLLIVALLMSLSMTVISAFIRLSDTGMGCDVWPTCYTSNIWLDSEPGISIRAEDSNTGLRVIHRFTASAFGILMLMMMVLSLWFRKVRPAGVIESLLAFSLTFILAIVGMYTPNVENPLITFTNVVGGMLLSAILFFWMKKLTQPKLRFWRAPPIQIMTTITIVLVMMSGAWVSANFAAVACDSVFNCKGLESASIGDAFSLSRHLVISEGRLITDGHESMIGLAHHLLTLVMVLMLAYLLYTEIRKRNGIQSMLVLSSTAVLLVIQGLLGLVTGSLLSAVLHSVLAVLLLLSILNLFKVESFDA